MILAKYIKFLKIKLYHGQTNFWCHPFASFSRIWLVTIQAGIPKKETKKINFLVSYNSEGFNKLQI